MVIYFDSFMYIGTQLARLGLGPVHSLCIDGPATISPGSQQYQAIYDGAQVSGADWSIISGNYATVDTNGLLSVSSEATGSTVILGCEYAGLTASKGIAVSEVVVTHSLEIGGANTVNAETCQYLALYDNAEVTSSAWSIVSGSSYATIDNTGLLTVLPGASGSSVEVSCRYAGLEAFKLLDVTYVSGSSAETETETEIVVDPETGQTTETTTTTTTTTDAQGNVTTETTTSETVTNEDGSSSQTETTEVINPDGSSTSNSTIVNYNENGDVMGSSENTTQVNADGSSASTTTNFNENGDPESKINENTDTSGNVSTQDIEYDENGDEVVTGYTIDTSAGSGDGKEIVDGVNTEYYAFDVTRGFVLDLDFTIDFNNQPASQDQGHHNVLTAKRASPEPWYGFQLRQSNKNKYIQLGTQFVSGSNTNTTISPVDITGSVARYTIKITYDPTAATDKFVCQDLISGTTVFTKNDTFPDLPELAYLKVTLGYSMDPNGDPYRYSNITVHNFSIVKTTSVVAPVISCNGKQVAISCSDPEASIHCRLNQTGGYYLYTSPIIISDDTVVEAYSMVNGQASATVLENCVYTGLKRPVISSNGEEVTITCTTAGAEIHYRLNQSGSYSTYTAPIPLSEDVVVEAYSTLNEETSATVIASCSYHHDYSADYLTFRVLTGGTIKWGAYGSGYNKAIEYQLNAGSWTPITASASSTINVAAGDVVRFRGNNTTYAGSKSNYAAFSSGSATFDVEGNIMSLVYGDNFANSSSLSGTYNFCSIFKQTNVVSAENLILPAKTLTNYCYRAMFSKSPTLVKAPALPATTLATGVYWYMFEECPITTAPDLLAPTLTNSCYGYMFISCSNLSRIRCTATSITAASCSLDWVKNVAPTGTFIKASGSAWYTGNSGIPTGWTVYEDGEEPEPGPDDGSWKYAGQSIDLPYSINAIDGHSSGYNKGSFSFTAKLNLDTVQPTYLWFDHADQSADVYVNGTKVTTHWGGYNSFYVDITDHVISGSNNVEVILNNTTRNALAPCDGDFNFNATLGNVEAITSPVLPETEYGYDGFRIKADVTASSAAVTVETSVPTASLVECIIKSGSTTCYSSAQSASGEVSFTTSIANPRLWDGVDDPFLYDVTLNVYHSGSLCYTATRPYGFRYFRYARNEAVPGTASYTGLMLNDHPYFLRGVCMHQDIEGKANALISEDIAHDFSIIQELGCNFIRTAHYPHPREFYDWCDRLGIVVETEVPWVNKAQSTMPADYYTHLESQFVDMVTQHYNHPSIFFWCLGNEIKTDDKDFAKGKVEGYRDLIRTYDTSRWVGYVMSHSYPNGLSAFNNPNVDWIGQNMYVGWYQDPNSNNPTSRISSSLGYANAQNVPMAYSEYGCGGTRLCHSDDYLNTTTRGNNARHDIEYQMWLHEGHIAAIKNFPQLLFSAQWVLFDFAVSSRNEGYTVCLDGVNASTDENLRRLNNKGLVERDHTTKKDTFYLYKAWWNPTSKFVHICGKDYIKNVGREIKCYTNDSTSSLSLYVNGTLTSTASVANNIATFPTGSYRLGDTLIVSGSTTSDSFTFTSVATQI